MTSAGILLDLKSITLRSLTAKRSLQSFRCSEHEIDGWANAKAHKFHEQRRSRVFTAHLPGNELALGYYALSLSLEPSEKISSSTDRARFNSGAYFLYITHLGVMKQLQGQGLGRLLLIDAISKAHRIADWLPIYGVGLRSLNDKSTTFYAKHGFAVAPDETTTPLMILNIWTIIELIDGVK
jgi:GNAT superfamily N-acetyltransferase